jgi:hypothetical protein
MTPTSLVNHGEELEVDLINAPGEIDDQRRTILASDHPGHEAMRQTPLDQVGRSGVQPVLVEVEISRNGCSSGQERVREGPRKAKFPLDGDGREIHVPGGTTDKTERRECGAAVAAAGPLEQGLPAACPSIALTHMGHGMWPGSAAPVLLNRMRTLDLAGVAWQSAPHDDGVAARRR